MLLTSVAGKTLKPYSTVPNRMTRIVRCRLSDAVQSIRGREWKYHE